MVRRRGRIVTGLVRHPDNACRFGNVAIREAKIGMQETPIGTKGRAGIIEAQGDTSSTLIQAGGDDYSWCSRFPRTISGTTTSSRAGPESPAHCGQGMSDREVGALVHMACGCGFLPAARLGNDDGRSGKHAARSPSGNSDEAIRRAIRLVRVCIVGWCAAPEMAAIEAKVRR